jgi:NADH:ubiquinone oxidoreductase subunit D
VQKATVLHGEGYEAIKAADAAEREAALVLNVGGLVRVDGVDYRVRRADPYGNIDLVEEAA